MIISNNVSYNAELAITFPFRGHYWGAAGIVKGSVSADFCIPLSLGIHQGLIHVDEKGDAQADKETLIVADYEDTLAERCPGRQRDPWDKDCSDGY